MPTRHEENCRCNGASIAALEARGTYRRRGVATRNGTTRIGSERCSCKASSLGIRLRKLRRAIAAAEAKR